MISMNVRRPTIFPTTVLLGRHSKHVRITSNSRQFSTMLTTLVRRHVMRNGPLFIKLYVITIKRSTNPHSKRTMTPRTRLDRRNSILLGIIMRISNFIQKMMILIVTYRRLRLTRRRQRTILTGKGSVRVNRPTPTFIMNALTLINNNNTTPWGIFQGSTRRGVPPRRGFYYLRFVVFQRNVRKQGCSCFHRFSRG